MTAWFPDALRDPGDRVALVDDARALTYAELAGRVERVVERLGTQRRLVLLAGSNHVDAVVHYLAALAGRHPVILAGADNAVAIEALTAAYDPDVVVRPSGDGSRWETDERRIGSRHALHPDLALLLSTSGSTGSPKLVRLSRENVQSNAESIAEFLAIRPDDRAITSLPMAYCYGLSVLNTHLLRGASVALTDRSVIEPAFWDLARRARATSFAGVPYTFDLLDRVGFAGMSLPDLRAVTQAGGRLDPEQVRRYAALGRRSGWELYVMYGQTEATARMAYLPPQLADERPGSIGHAIPGGTLRIDPVPDAPNGTGELVYRGPNVMLGYATGPADLVLGRAIDELRTGDLARLGSDGLWEIVGRRSDFVKIAGLRVDPAGVERIVERAGARGCAVGTDEALVIVAEEGAPDDLAATVRSTICLPPHAVRVVTLPALPRLPNGKPDRPAIRAIATAASTPADPVPASRDAESGVRTALATALGVPVVRDGDSFAGLGGDSLSYVEATLGLEDVLGHVPDGWETMTVRELAARAPSDVAGEGGAGRLGRLGRWRSVEMSVVLRAVAIVLIVGSHIGMFFAFGGAHVLMAVAGYNFARFRLTSAARLDRVRGQLRAVARIALPAMAWVAAVMLLTDEYELRHLLLVNALVRDELWGNLWFIELLVYIGLLMAALLAVPALDRAERRWPFAAALTILGVGLLFRFEVVDLGVPYTMPVLWLFAIGWAASRAERAWQKGLVLAVAFLAVPGYFESPLRTAIILGGLALLIGVRRVSVPAPLARVGAVLAGASLYIYLVHWEVWPIFSGWYGLPSLLASLGAGIGLWLVAGRIPALLGRARSALADWTERHGTSLGRRPEARAR